MSLSERNKCGVTFTLLGFSDCPELQVPLFLVFLAIYSVTVVGNLGMIVIIKINPKLHTPMYFFLSHLSFVDFCYSSIIAPKMLGNLVAEDRSISFLGCVAQFFLFCTVVVTEVFLLAIMGYDHFVAICNPLLYTVAMSQRLSSGRRKAFSTCASHLTAITIFHGTILFLYCVPNSKNSRHTVKVASVFYTVVIPMFSPVIYSQRNKDVKNTVSRIKDIKLFFH
ncbi:olfactory receptor 5D16-like [Elephas maximus indicus]|uniref:olfactory receptor 5D16-like n=1 Tax=Elephas maximus indicus TaxID=99487 RepID=UPI0021161AC4|nr:olfactory receptor 5D16-like [Elephas maximus indicus]